MNPYQVLGVGRDATTEQIKAAYHALIKKWHPDLYLGTPEYDKAHDITVQANQAYELLRDHSNAPSSGWEARFYAHQEKQQEFARRQQQSREQAAAGAQAQAEYAGEPAQDEPQQEDSARLLSLAYELAVSGRIDAALRHLARIKERGARWHYVRGLTFHHSKDYDSALTDFESALRLDPGNSEYRMAWMRSVSARRARRRTKTAIGAVAAAAAVTAAIIILK